MAASLNYINLNQQNKTASLIPYPDWKANTLPPSHESDAKTEKKIVGSDDNHITSTFRIRVDPCDRLWVMDTGLVDILGKPEQVAPPSIVVFDLNTDKIIRRYQMKTDDLKEDSFFANIV